MTFRHPGRGGGSSVTKWSSRLKVQKWESSGCKGHLKPRVLAETLREMGRGREERSSTSQGHGGDATVKWGAGKPSEKKVSRKSGCSTWSRAAYGSNAIRTRTGH